jgi:hypothetical protein
MYKGGIIAGCKHKRGIVIRRGKGIRTCTRHRSRIDAVFERRPY